MAEEIRVAEQRKLHPPILAVTSWLEVHDASDRPLVRQLLSRLDAGEAESIALALEVHSDLLLIDEKQGRKIAAEKGIRTVGLIGTLLASKQKGLIEAGKPILNALRDETGFWLSDALFREALRQAGEQLP